MNAIVVSSLVAALLATFPQAAPALVGWSVVETAHFRFRFPPEPLASPSTFPAEMERAYAELQAVFGSTLPGRIDFYVWNTPADAEALLGRPPGFANAPRLLIHATADQTRGHELTHVLVHHAVTPEVTTRFIAEGTAVAFDLSGRDHMGVARAAVARSGTRMPGVHQLWSAGGAVPDAVLYPVAGAFVEHLFASGGRERFLRLLRRQTIEYAREVYGSDLDRWIAAFESALGTPAASGPPTQEAANPALEALRAKAQVRMRQDLAAFTREQRQDIESRYQAGSRDPRVPENRARLLALIDDYPSANRAGCALLYVARTSVGGEREALLRRAIESHGDAWYGDGTQVGAFARALLAAHYADTGRRDEAATLAAEVARDFPDAVDHAGRPLTDILKRLDLLP